MRPVVLINSRRVVRELDVSFMGGIFARKPNGCQFKKSAVRWAMIVGSKRRALALLWPAHPLFLFAMHSANPEALEAPLHFNFASDVIHRWANEQPGAPALWCVHARA